MTTLETIDSCVEYMTGLKKKFVTKSDMDNQDCISMIVLLDNELERLDNLRIREKRRIERSIQVQNRIDHVCPTCGENCLGTCIPG